MRERAAADVRSRHNNNVCDLAARDCLRKAMMPEKAVFSSLLLFARLVRLRATNKQPLDENFPPPPSRESTSFVERKKCFSTNTLGDADKPPPTINCQFIWPLSRDDNEVLFVAFLNEYKVVVTDFHPAEEKAFY